MIPLIAVDELPDWIDIGLPRELTVEQTVGLYNLGMVPHSGDTYRVRIIEPNSQEEFVWKRVGDSSRATLVSSGVCVPGPGHRTVAPPEQQSQRIPYHTTAAASPRREPSSIHRPSSAAELACQQSTHPNIITASSNPNRVTRAEDEHSVRWADLVERSIARDTETQDLPRHATLLAPPPSPQVAPYGHQTVHRDVMPADHRASVPHSMVATSPQTTNVKTDAATPTTNNAAPVSVAASLGNPGVAPSNSNSTTSSSSLAATAAAPSASSSSSSSPPSTPQEYCRHWCQHGTCKWGTFCRHKHAMPTTLEGLLEVGLCEIPAWWISATGIGMSTGGKVTKQTAAASAAGTSPTTVNGNGSSSAPPPPPPAPGGPSSLAQNLHHLGLLPTMVPGGAPSSSSPSSSSSKKLSNRKLKAQQREFNNRLRLLSSMMTMAMPPGGYQYPLPALRHPADALLMHGMHGLNVNGPGGPGGPQQSLSLSLEKQIQQLQQQQQKLEREQREREREREQRKGEKTPLDRSKKNVKVTFNEDGTVSLMPAGVGAGAGERGKDAREVSGGGTAAHNGTDAGAGAPSASATVANTSETGKPAANGGAAEGQVTGKLENCGQEKETKQVKGLANSMHAPKQDQRQGQAAVVTPLGNMSSMKATCEDENEVVPLLVEI